MKRTPQLSAFFLAVVLAACLSAQAATKPVRVFILAGQSNMQGHGIVAADPKHNGGKGTLEFLAKDPATAKRFTPLLDAAGQWRKRDDVWIAYLDRKGPLTVGYGARQDMIGPELGFGWVIGDSLDEPVLLVKCAWGGKSLAVDFRPPSAGKLPYSLGEKADAAIAKEPAIVGKYYRETVALTKDALAHVKELVPGSDGRCVLSGFGWHQGWNDRINDNFTAEYESNMAHFIRDMRKAFAAPELPFVIAETGMGGPEEKHPRALALMKAQAAVAERLEFKGNVAFVGTRAFWRPKEQSPSAQGYHWNSNAETHYLIGEAMGEAMKRLTGASYARAGEAIHAEPSKPLPRVLLIGDSICGGYCKAVQRELDGKAVVVKNEGNAEYTGTGLKKLDEWLGDGKWDVIHFNWGLWDMYGWQYAKVDRSPAVYQERLDAIVSRLKKTGARLVWATTTPACPGPEQTMRKRFKTELRITPAVELQYFDAALRVMNKHDVQVNDLHAIIERRWERNPPSPDHDNVHFDGSTNNALGKQVAAAILQALGSSAQDGSQAETKKSVKEFLLSEAAAAASFNWQTTDVSLALRNGDRTVWRLVVDPKQQKTYFHPLATVNGEVLTALHPADHPWHCGLWWSWKYINGVNYWDWDWAKGNNGKTEGVNELNGKAVATNRDFSARVVLKFSYHPTDMPPVLTETRTLSISSPDKNGSYRIDWTSVFIAGDKPVKLDRTPPSKRMGGYAGLSVRFPKGLEGWRFLTSENAATAAQGNGKKAQWADFSGPASGIAVFDHPENLRHPSLWYLNEDLPFFSPAVLYKEPLELAPKQELKLRYRVLVHSGTAQMELLDKEWKAFAQ